MTDVPEGWNAALVEEFRQRLLLARAALLRTVERTDDELATLETHQAGSLVEDASTDAAAATLATLEGREKHELDEIENALGRLGSGTFGLCEQCGRPVGIARLRAMPATRQCLACQRQVETR
jgi:RNA polymerase-binding protein DksA